MSTIPKYLYTKEIKSCIYDLICFCDAKDFYSLDTIHQDQLVALGIAALGGDIDIVIGSSANKQLAKILNSYDRDEEIELINSIKESARDALGIYFERMIEDELIDLSQSSYSYGRRDTFDGEPRYL